MVMSLLPATHPCSIFFSDACGAACYSDEASTLQNTYLHTFCCERQRRLLVYGTAGTPAVTIIVVTIVTFVIIIIVIVVSS